MQYQILRSNFFDCHISCVSYVYVFLFVFYRFTQHTGEILALPSQSMWKICIENWTQMNSFNMYRELVCVVDTCVWISATAFANNAKRSVVMTHWNDWTWNWKSYIWLNSFSAVIYWNKTNTHTRARTKRAIIIKLNLIHSKIINSNNKKTED